MNASTDAETALVKKLSALINIAGEREDDHVEFDRLTDKAVGVSYTLDTLRSNSARFESDQMAMTATMNDVARRLEIAVDPGFVDGLTLGLKTVKDEYDVEFGH